MRLSFGLTRWANTERGQGQRHESAWYACGPIPTLTLIGLVCLSELCRPLGVCDLRRRGHGYASMTQVRVRGRPLGVCDLRRRARVRGEGYFLTSHSLG